MKKIRLAFAGLLLVALLMAPLSGCGFGNKFDIYEDAELYTVGDLRYDANEVHTVRVYWTSGSLCLSQSDGDTLTGSEDKGSLSEAQRMRWLLRDGVLTVRFCESGYRGRINGAEKNLELQIPSDVELTVETVSADMDLGQLTGKAVTVSAVSGNITAAGVMGETVAISTVSGELSIQRIKANSLTASSVSGDIKLLSAEVSKMNLSTVSGEMIVELASNTEAELNSTSGDVRLYKGDVGMTVTFDTVSGELDTKLTYEKLSKDQYRFEEGTSRITVETVSGDLHVGWEI